jgi:hypothetical protein
MRTWLTAAAAAGVLAGCSPTPSGEVTVEESMAAEGLAATMQVEAGADAVRLTLHVTNTTSAPIELGFTSGQRYDFQVAEVGDGGRVGETVWTWSADRSFIQAVGTETLAPNASLSYSEEWATGGLRGEFVGIGTLTSSTHPVRQMARFELAGGE